MMQAFRLLPLVMCSRGLPANSLYNRCVPVTEQLRQAQVGLGVAGVAEAAVHTIHKFINNAHPHDIMLMIDMQNAFNSLRGDHIHEKSITTSPGICTLIHGAYSTPSALLIGDKIIAFSSDVQQGDPLGPLLLAVNDIAHSVGTPLNIWYLNVVMIGGPSESVIDSYPKIVADLSSIGLEVDTSKTEVISYHTESGKNVFHSLKDVKIVPVDDSELLGSPLFAGTLRRILNEKTEQLKLATGILMQIERHIVIFCCGTVSQHPKLIYI